MIAWLLMMGIDTSNHAGVSCLASAALPQNGILLAHLRWCAQILSNWQKLRHRAEQHRPAWMVLKTLQAAPARDGILLC
jgi:hypothetical protein